MGCSDLFLWPFVKNVDDESAMPDFFRMIKKPDGHKGLFSGIPLKQPFWLPDSNYTAIFDRDIQQEVKTVWN